MGVFEKYMLFIIYAMATITLVTCDDYDNTLLYFETLKIYNLARAIHDADMLYLDDELCQEATEYLNNLINGTVDINENSWYYNVTEFEGTEPPTAKEVFYSMYKEGIDYDYNNVNLYDTTDKFTGIVWKNTELVGFGLVSKDQTHYFSAIYRPIIEKAGNYIENVGKPKYYDIYESFLELIY